MSEIIENILFDFKLTVSLIKLYDGLSVEWENMDLSSRSYYSDFDGFVEVQLRFAIQNFIFFEGN